MFKLVFQEAHDLAFKDDSVEPQFIAAGSTGSVHKIACLNRPGLQPGLVWLGGFKSDMRATKAEAIDAYACDKGRAFLRFDYSGHGESGGHFDTGTIGDWLNDALAAIAACAGPAPLLIGSSMGAWIALLAALRLRGQGSVQAPCGLVLIAPAIDFTQKLMWEAFPQNIHETIMREGVWYRPSAYSPDPTPITRTLIEEGRNHLLMGHPILPGCPVAILQGMQDPDVPWRHALDLVEHLPGDKVTLSLIKDGDHRLSRPQDLALLIETIERLLPRKAA